MSQLQETVQAVKKKELTFAEICPQWSLQLAGVEQHDIDISSYQACIVGEAHRVNGTSYISNK